MNEFLFLLILVTFTVITMLTMAAGGIIFLGAVDSDVPISLGSRIALGVVGFLMFVLPLTLFIYMAIPSGVFKL